MSEEKNELDLVDAFSLGVLWAIGEVRENSGVARYMKDRNLSSEEVNQLIEDANESLVALSSIEIQEERERVEKDDTPRREAVVGERD